MQGDQLWCGGADESLDLAVESLDLGVEGLPAAGQVTQGRFDRGQEQPVGVVGQREEVIGFGAQSQAAVHQGPLGEVDELCRGVGMARRS